MNLIKMLDTLQVHQQRSPLLVERRLLGGRLLRMRPLDLRKLQLPQLPSLPMVSQAAFCSRVAWSPIMLSI